MDEEPGCDPDHDRQRDELSEHDFMLAPAMAGPRSRPSCVEAVPQTSSMQLRMGMSTARRGRLDMGSSGASAKRTTISTRLASSMADGASHLGRP